MGTIKKAAEHKYQIQRDYAILKAREEGYETPIAISKALGISYGVVEYTLQTYKAIADCGEEYEYIDIALELCELLDEAGCDVDRCITLIMKALWVEGFNTRDKIAAIDADKLEELTRGHRIHRAGKKATDVFLNWQKSYADAAKAKAAAKAKTKKKVSAKSTAK